MLHIFKGAQFRNITTGEVVNYMWRPMPSFGMHPNCITVSDGKGNLDTHKMEDFQINYINVD